MKTTDIIVGELIGWRCWEYRQELVLDIPHDECLLRSLVYDFFWYPEQKIIEADVMFSRSLNKKPVEKTYISQFCGIHSYKHPRGLTEWTLATGMTIEYPLVVGTIQMWGDVWEHEEGYRAEYCKIRGLDSVVIDHVEYKDNELLKRIQNQYNIGYSPK